MDAFMEGAVNILVATSPVTRGISLPQVYQRERECVIVCVGEREVQCNVFII